MLKEKEVENEIDIQGFLHGNRNYGAIGMHNRVRPLFSLPRRAESLTAYHILLTEPYFAWHKGPFQMREYERVTAELSVRLWRRYNGPIYLMTDRQGAAYCREQGMEKLYDGVDDSLSGQKYCIDMKKYWAAGKIIALLNIQAPCVIIDLDMLIWKPLELGGCQVAAAHTEPIIEELYPPFAEFIMSPRYQFPKQWDLSVEPLNTSFVYFADEGFKNDYARQAIRFMQYERNTQDSLSRCMIFAEQRILGMCATAYGIQAKTFLEYGKPLDRQEFMTHIWSGKELLRTHTRAESEYNVLCGKKIAQLAEMGV